MGSKRAKLPSAKVTRERENVHEPLIEERVLSRRRYERGRVCLNRAQAGRTPEPQAARRFVLDHISCWRVDRGEASVRTRRMEAKARAGEWLVAGPGERWISIAKGTRILSITFVWRDASERPVVAPGAAWTMGEERARGLAKAGFRLARVVADELSGTGGGDRVGEGKGTMAGQARVDAAFAAWRAAFGEMLVRERKMNAAPALDPRMERALEVWEPPRVGRSVEAAAQAAGLSVAHFRRVCARVLGRSPAEHCRLRLAEEVMRRLGLPGATVKAVAHDLGFRRTQHFSHWVRGRFGRTPQALMRDLAGGGE